MDSDNGYGRPQDAPPLQSLYSPQSVAVIGVSEDPEKWGSKLLRGLIDGGYQGAIYPINPRYEAIYDLKCYPSIDTIGERIDLVVIALPAATVPNALDSVLSAEVDIAVIIASGYADVGDSGRQEQQTLVRRARANGTRIVGPNCAGVYSAPTNLYACMGLEPRPIGGVAVLSQSGSVGTAIFKQGSDVGLGFHSFIGVGNQADITFSEYLDYLGKDDDCSAVIIYLEGVVDGESLLDSVEQCSRQKPVVVMVGGRSEPGRRAVSSHTGSLATSSHLAAQLLRQAGAHPVDSIEEIVAATAALTSCSIAPVRRVGVLSDGGGFGVLASDIAGDFGLSLPQFSEVTRERLADLLPPMASSENPVDLWDVDPRNCVPAVNAILEDSGVDALLVASTFGINGLIFGEPALEDDRRRAELLSEIAMSSTKPMIIQSCFARDLSISASASIRKSGIPSFESITMAIRGLAAIGERAEWLARGAGYNGQTPLMRSVHELTERPMTEPELYLELNQRGVSTPKFVVAGSGDAIPADLNFPVVAKAVIASEHKSDVGAVRLNISNYQELREALTDLSGFNVPALVAEQVEPGLELIVSAFRDETFGELVLFGFGGRFTDALKTAVIARSCASRVEIEAAMARAQPLYAALRHPTRGVPMDAFHNLVAGAIDILRTYPGLHYIELNPAIASGEAIVVVDAKVSWVH